MRTAVLAMRPTADQVHATVAHYGTWVSYGGNARVVLAVGLLAIAAGVAYAAVRLRLPFRPAKPGRAARTVVIVTWLLSIVVLLAGLVTDLEHLQHEHMLRALPVNPITPVTFSGVCLTFVIVMIAGSSYGARTVLASATIAALAAPMIFELPFDLIVMARTYPAIPPDPALVRLEFFAPLFVVEVTTIALLSLSPMVRVSRASLVCLALMLGIFAVWALFGFGYPSAPVPITLNMASKILTFATTLNLFLPQRAAVRPDGATSSSVSLMQCAPSAPVGS
jgi:hypothetical protein